MTEKNFKPLDQSFIARAPRGVGEYRLSDVPTYGAKNLARGILDIGEGVGDAGRTLLNLYGKLVADRDNLEIAKFEGFFKGKAQELDLMPVNNDADIEKINGDFRTAAEEFRKTLNLSGNGNPRADLVQQNGLDTLGRAVQNRHRKCLINSNVQGKWENAVAAQNSGDIELAGKWYDNYAKYCVEMTGSIPKITRDEFLSGTAVNRFKADHAQYKINAIRNDVIPFLQKRNEDGSVEGMSVIKREDADKLEKYYKNREHEMVIRGDLMVEELHARNELTLPAVEKLYEDGDIGVTQYNNLRSRIEGGQEKISEAQREKSLQMILLDIFKLDTSWMNGSDLLGKRAEFSEKIDAAKLGPKREVEARKALNAALPVSFGPEKEIVVNNGAYKKLPHYLAIKKQIEDDQFVTKREKAPHISTTWRFFGWKKEAEAQNEEIDRENQRIEDEDKFRDAYYKEKIELDVDKFFRDNPNATPKACWDFYEKTRDHYRNEQAADLLAEYQNEER